MSLRSLALTALVLSLSTAAHAQVGQPQTALGISTHVLDLARGVGGAGVPVTLELKTGDTWHLIGRAVTESNGRAASLVSSRPGAEAPGAGLYRLTFDMDGFWDSLSDTDRADAMAVGAAFFPEIVVQFRVTNASADYHVPVVVSPYGYSTYRGN